jgi:hypothetical protein
LSCRSNTGREPPNGTITNNNTARNPATSQTIGQFSSTRSHPFQDDNKFWVVFTGACPGVYEGRHASSFSQILFMLTVIPTSASGEQAMGKLANPTFVTASSLKDADRLFVEAYMDSRVARFT